MFFLLQFGQPILERPLSSIGPSPDDFDVLTGGAQFVIQSIMRPLGGTDRDFSSFEKLCFFWQHCADPCSLIVGKEDAGSRDPQGGAAGNQGLLVETGRAPTTGQKRIGHLGIGGGVVAQAQLFAHVALGTDSDDN